MKFGYNTFKDTVLKKLMELLGDGIVEEHTKIKTNGVKSLSSISIFISLLSYKLL